MSQKARETAHRRLFTIRARQLRREATPAEVALWKILRSRKVAGLKFRRQQRLDRFIADFFCAELKLVIEVDGAVHNQRTDLDVLRQDILEDGGLTLVRFTNQDVLKSPERVIERILEIARNVRNAHGYPILPP